MSDVFTRPHFDASEGLIHFQRIQDVEPILERNKELQKRQQTFAGSFRHIGSIPNVILEKWMNDEGVNVLAMSGPEFGQFVKKKLRDPDNAWLRTTSGRI